jgi:hypothetical protein
MIRADNIKDHILKKSIEAMEKLKIDLQAPEVIDVSCTCDVWTSPYNAPFFALTGHWIDANGVLKVNNWRLCCIFIEDKNSGFLTSSSREK